MTSESNPTLTKLGRHLVGVNSTSNFSIRSGVELTVLNQLPGETLVSVNEVRGKNQTVLYVFLEEKKNHREDCQ